ncbi:hypothetical protein [Actinomadura sp. NTSP31]|uniref:hypothetical protein n=1 Tax=Actinomadura sp. NTSP31 TaxID=1735447 RepID=UPI0035C11DEB
MRRGAAAGTRSSGWPTWDASALGLRVVMIADANAAPRDREHNATLHTVYRSFGDVRPAADVLAMINAG